MTFDGRVEALIRVPSGTTVSATTDLGTSTVTIPTGNYFWTSAGGNTGLLATIAAQLNASAPPAGYPRTAGAMNAAVGWGTWSAGWLLDETSGNLGPVFGSPTLTASGSPTYGTAGPRGAADAAIGFGDGTGAFSGGAVFDITATDDLCVAGVAMFTATPTGATYGAIAGKPSAGLANGWVVTGTGGSQYGLSGANASVQTQSMLTSANDPDFYMVGAWHVFIAVRDRAAGTVRFGIQRLSDGKQLVAAAVADAGATWTVADAFKVGANSWVGGNRNYYLAGLYVGSGAGVAVDMSANLATALSNFASAINAAWLATLSTGASGTGRVTLNVTGGAIQPAWALSWTTTTLRDVAGFTSDVWAGYPRSAAEMASAVGYGTWSAGWLCDDSSGSLAPAFGATSLTASGVTTYGTSGPRGGVDRAVSFGDGTGAFAGGSIYDIAATDDLCIAGVAMFTAVPTGGTYGGIASKVSAGFANGWSLAGAGGGSYGLFGGPGAGGAASSLSTSDDPDFYMLNAWHAFIAVRDRAAGTIRFGIQRLSDGRQLIAAAGADSGVSWSVADAFKLGASAWVLGNQSYYLAAIYVGSGASAAANMSANLATALSNFSAMVGSRTGTKQARGLWIPNCPLVTDSEPRRAPKISDLRTTTSPTGTVLGLVGNTFYRQRNVGWSHVPKARTWEQATTLANASWETFFNETQLGLGATTWFTPCSPIQLYDHTGTLLGLDANGGVGLVNGWQLTGVTSIEPPRASGTNGWTGYYAVQLPEIVSSG